MSKAIWKKGCSDKEILNKVWTRSKNNTFLTHWATKQHVYHSFITQPRPCVTGQNVRWSLFYHACV